MHALGQYLDQQARSRGWTTSELARRAGLTKQSVANLLSPDKDHLGRMLEPRTFNGLAGALGVPAEVLVLKAAEAMGIPVPPPPQGGPTDLVDHPPATMERLTRFLREDVPSAVLVGYLRRYLELAAIVGETLAVHHGYEWGALVDPGPGEPMPPAGGPGTGASPDAHEGDGGDTAP